MRLSETGYAYGGPTTTWFSDWDYTSVLDEHPSTAPVIDRRLEKTVGKPYRKKSDVRFDTVGAGKVVMVDIPDSGKLSNYSS